MNNRPVVTNHSNVAHATMASYTITMSSGCIFVPDAYYVSKFSSCLAIGKRTIDCGNNEL